MNLPSGSLAPHRVGLGRRGASRSRSKTPAEIPRAVTAQRELRPATPTLAPPAPGRDDVAETGVAGFREADMAGRELWPIIHTERHALADDLAGLTPEQWATPSLCGRWSVHDVLAHMLATAKETPGRFFRGFAGA